MKDLRNHPLRSLYLLYQGLSTLLVRIPWWVLINTLPRFRGRPSWTLRQAITTRLVKHVIDIFASTGAVKEAGDHVTPSSGRGIKQVWIEPAPADLISEHLKEPWMSAARVEPVRIPAYWIDKKGLEETPAGAPPQSSEKIALYFHGGAYFLFSASPKDDVVTGPIANGTLKHVPSVTRVLSVEYRLSKVKPPNPQDANPFPAALLDALASYCYLIHTVKVTPENILVMGDSAGGNLSLALVRYLVENAGVISGLPPPPGQLLLLSPWADLSDTARTSVDFKPGENVDLIDAESPLIRYGTHAFLGPHGSDAALNRYISAASVDPRAEIASFVGFPRTMIVAGGAEMLMRSIRTLKERMQRDLAEKVTYYEAKDAVHDYVIASVWEPEITSTFRAIARWMGD